MKALFFFFLLANVALYLWATQGAPQAGFRLPEPDAGHNLSQMELDTEQHTTNGQNPGCLRIGPFSTQQTLTDGRRLLVNRGYGLAQTRTAAREIHTYQVLAGPFLSDIARDNARVKLEDNSFSVADLARGDGKVLMLREFAREAQASAFAAEITPLGLPIEIEKKVRTLGPLYWIDVPDVVTESRRQELGGLEWGDAMTQLTPIPCPASG